MNQLNQHQERDFGVDCQSGFSDPLVGMGPDSGSSDKQVARPIGCKHESPTVAVCIGPTQLIEVQRGRNGLNAERYQNAASSTLSRRRSGMRRPLVSTCNW